jgi:formylglycine-generating enzyme required for sulfatase activity
MSRSLALAIALFAMPTSAAAVAIEWVPIGDAGNLDDTTGFGAVAYDYQISKYEITNEQYTEFLNAKAASDPLGLYNLNMGDARINLPSGDSACCVGHGGITRSGIPGNYTYSAIANREDMPVNWVSFYDTLRFANWLNNGNGTGDTETGAYTLLGGNSETVIRNIGATILLASENEWYKAAYYDPASAHYFNLATGHDSSLDCTAPGATANTANCYGGVGDLTVVGSYTGSASPYGTFDQAGNALEWTETLLFLNDPDRIRRVMLGGSFLSNQDYIGSWYRGDYDRYPGPTAEDNEFGFRLLMIPGGYVPEPGTGLLVIVGLLGLGGWRKVTA